MAMMQPATAESERRSRPVDRAAIVVVFALVVGFTYSDDIVEFILDATHTGSSGLRWLVLALDCTLIVGAALFKRRIAFGDRTCARPPWAEFLRRLLRSWWAVGAVLVVAVHLVMIGTAAPRARLGDTHCGFGAVWHEYTAFVVTVQATAIGLATLVWLLLTNTADTTSVD
jgi:hypothetical protein